MITLIRNIPFDIKLYNCGEKTCWRALHKSHSMASSLIWECIDVAFFNQTRHVRIEKRLHRTISRLVLTRVIFFVARNTKIRNFLLINLYRIWRKLRVEYGYEQLDRSLFEGYKSVDFHGCKVSVFSKVENYLRNEYGMRYMENKKEYSCGGWSKPSHIVTSPFVITGHR